MATTLSQPQLLRCRPSPLTSTHDDVALTNGDFEVNVKNTFLELSELPSKESCMGMKSAPASMHRQGAVQFSLAEAVQGQNSDLGTCKHVGIEQLSPTTASTPPSTPSGESFWPPTPSGTPHMRIPISLVEMMGAEECETGSVSLTTVNSEWWHWANATHSDAFGSCGTVVWMPWSNAVHSDLGSGAWTCGPDPAQIFACSTNVPVPKFAPPSAPAPGSASPEETPIFPPLEEPSPSWVQ